MIESLILAAPAGGARDRLVACFEGRATRLHVLAREDAVSGQRLCIEDEQVRWDGEDVLNATAAVVLDGGFMWPVPRLAPDEETWNAFRNRFDEYLRDERESASLWLSLLEILTDRVPRVINPQPAFAHAALKPVALDRLRDAGVGTVSQLDTNDPDAVAVFAAAHAGPLLRLASGDLPAAPRWLQPTELSALPLESEPVCLQAPDGRETCRVTVVAGRAAAVDGRPGAAGIAPEIAAALPVVSETLALGFGEVVFRPAADRWAVSDFTPAPALGDWADDEAEAALGALARALREPAP